MIDFVYPEGYQLFAGVDEVGRSPLIDKRKDLERGLFCIVLSIYWAIGQS